MRLWLYKSVVQNGAVRVENASGEKVHIIQKGECNSMVTVTGECYRILWVISGLSIERFSIENILEFGG